MALQDSASATPIRQSHQSAKRQRNSRLVALRDSFEMVSGIFLDLRGDLADSFAETIRPLRNSIRRFMLGKHF